jgi:hypothetical protein
MAALVSFPPAGGHAHRWETWCWYLPGPTLRARKPVPFRDGVLDLALTASGRLATIAPNAAAVPELGWDGAPRQPRRCPARRAARVRHRVRTGPVHGRRHRGGRVHRRAGRAARDRTSPDPVVARMRAHAGLVADWDVAGRIAVVEPATHRLVTALRARA